MNGYVDPSPDTAMSECEREPIHIPGAIQPHGAVIAVQIDTGLVTHASANLLAMLGYSPEATLGQPLQAIVGAAARRLLLAASTRHGAAVGEMHVLSGPDDAPLHLRAHRSGPRLCLDIEPVRLESWQRPTIAAVQSILETFDHAETRSQLCELAVRGLRAISGYDRVMGYRFDTDGHGEVISEARETALPPFLGLHYPANDIPPQARALFMRQRVGAIADSSYVPVPLLADPAQLFAVPLDLTHSTLRSVSPLHREYMRNMRTAASLTVGLALGSELWGMLVCHHRTARIAGHDIRAVADMIGQAVSLRLASLGEAEIRAQRLKRAVSLGTLVDRLAAPLPILDALGSAEAELLEVVGATGAVIRLSGTLRYLGNAPPPGLAERVLDILQAMAGGDVLAIDDLGLRHPELDGCTDAASGALLLPLAPNSDDAILWVRPERSRDVPWGGDPSKPATFDPVAALCPRASFDEWRETVSGHSVPWAAADLALASEVRRAVEVGVARRAAEDLARFDAERADSEHRKTILLATIDACPISITIADATQGDVPLIYANPMFLRMTGYAADEVIGRNCRFLHGPETDRHAAAELRQAIAAGKPAEVRLINYRKDRTPFLNLVILTPIHDDSGRLTAYMGSQSDVTHEARERAEVQRQKMEALGRMMGGVAHEINNMLQPVTLLGQEIIDKRLVVGEGVEHLKIVLDCSRKARGIIGDLLAFSRPSPLPIEVHNFVELLNHSLRLVRQAMPPTVALSVRIEGQPPPVAIDRTVFIQILLNLAINATAAMAGQGSLTFFLDEKPRSPEDGRAGEQVRFARLRVSDTGCGMDKTVLDRAFEPFFTTKPIGEGTGLGLSVVYGLIHEIGGTIALDSQPGRGTTVTILLPGRRRETDNGIDIGN